MLQSVTFYSRGKISLRFKLVTLFPQAFLPLFDSKHQHFVHRGNCEQTHLGPIFEPNYNPYVEMLAGTVDTG